MLVLLAACSTSTPDVQMRPIGRVGGTVTDVAGAPLSGVEVEIDGFVVETDDAGVYVADGIPPGDHVVRFLAEGYAPGWETTALHSWETVSLDAVLGEEGGRATIDTRTGDTTVTLDGITLELRDLVLDGADYDGRAEVRVTYLDPYSSDAAYAPGDLKALAFADTVAKDAGPTMPTQLVSNGMFNVEVSTPEGEALAASFAASMPVSNGSLPAAYALSAGDSVPLWRWDTDKGIWTEQGAGSVAGTAGALSFDFDISSTDGGWYNCDQPIQWTCSSGTIVDVLGFPIRGARVVAAGGWTTAETVTDENGEYDLQVAIGDTVQFSAYTFVGGRTWTAVWTETILGEGSCDAVPGYPIAVCREAGMVMADDLELHISGMDEGFEADQLRAWFWEPPGDPTLCDDFWLEIPLDTCVAISPEDFPENFQPRTVGIAHETRSVGSYLKLDTPREQYRIEQSHLDGNPVYLWETLDLDGHEILASPVDLRSGDIVRGTAPGDAGSYFGPIDDQRWVIVPDSIELDDVWGPLGKTSRTDGLRVDFPAGDADYLLAFVTSASDDTGLMCRASDDGRMELSGSDLSQLAPGHTTVSVYRPQVAWALGPDGLPIRLQAVSGEIVEVELK
ncbi:MAG: hypothetical protein GY913_15800 [Proteobacteria bacterium]|nr:hypothetical protein [Pseudomonadota bacterium]